MNKKRYFEIRSRLRTEKPVRPLLQVLFLNVLLLGTGLSAALSGWEFFAVLPFTVFMFRNFALMHDAVHNAILDQRWANNLVGEICGCFCFLPFETWRRSHLDHHIWSGNIEKDPVMALRIVLPRLPRNIQNFLTFSWRGWIPVLAALQQTLFWKLCFKRIWDEPTPAGVVRFAFPVMFWLSVFTITPSKMLWLSIVPSIVLYLILVEVVNFPHHLQLPMTKGETRHPLWEQYQSSRTCLYPPWFASLVVLNFNYHSEHHMFPDLPWHMLGAAHKIIRHELKDQQNIDKNLDWILQNRLKTLVDVVQPVELKKAA